MSPLSRGVFLTLVLAQAGHSVEEYSARLYDVLVPARFVSDLLSSDRRLGFAIFNVSLVVFGLWCYFGPVRHARPSAPVLAWFWVVLELLNGFAHIGWAVSAGSYRPGLATTPVLMAIALTLSWTLGRRIDDCGASRETDAGGPSS